MNDFVVVLDYYGDGIQWIPARDIEKMYFSDHDCGILLAIVPKLAEPKTKTIHGTEKTGLVIVLDVAMIERFKRAVKHAMDDAVLSEQLKSFDRMNEVAAAKFFGRSV